MREVPPLYQGRSVPFEKLSAGDFEKCVFACFVAIQSSQELRLDGQPAGSGDGGFDAYGIAISSKRTLCIQCKRQKASLGLPLLAKELAKVAMTARLENSDVGVHFFICTGGVTQELRHLLRETDRTQISQAARGAITGTVDSELGTLRERLNQAGDDPEDVVDRYVRGLDRLLAWDMEEFDAALSPAWDSALSVLERFFTVATVVREHPRPLFSRTGYQDWCRSFSAVVQPQLAEGDLPAGLADVSSAEPGQSRDGTAKRELLTVKSLASLSPGEAALVVAEGGAGKTTLLGLVRAEAARESSNALSVLITCAEYVPGMLDSMVHAQLGSQGGSWRTLPDRVQILCDGINEASPDAVKALFGELKPLLRSKSVSCIFTSREDSRVVRVVLPTVPCATLRLVPLSPGRVRALAHHELADESKVAAFADAHRLMAARAGGPFMWTPFAVRFALERWKVDRQLGDTLGDLLDDIVSARAERDLELASHHSSADLPRTSVLAIASAVAFEMLVVDGQAACSAAVVGATLKRAMTRCSSVFGADGLTTSEFVGLLRKHDLVKRTPDDSFQWNHQLVAGALAARHLAPQWEEHLAALQQPLADDAWVFATRLVPQPELDKYLGALFHADLLLGARATAELPMDGRDRSLQHVVKALREEQPEELRVAGLFALARIGTESALSFLRRLGKDRRNDIEFHAARALAYSGDRAFLLELGAEVDRRRQMGWGMSGGDISIWETASLADRIVIARQRLELVTPGEPANESLSLVGCDTSQRDLPVLEAHLRAAKDITAWRTALRAIMVGDHDRAQRLLDEALSDATHSASKGAILVAGHELGLAVDVDVAFSLLMDLSSSDLDGGAFLTKRDLAAKVLGELPLTAAIKRTIEERLPLSTDEARATLWQLSTHVASPLIATLALQTFTSDVESVGMAANFFLAHPSLRGEHHSALSKAAENYLQNKGNWFTFDSWRTLTLVEEFGFTIRTAELLQGMILRIADLLETSELGNMPAFTESEARIAEGFKIESARIRLEYYASFLASAAIAAKELLPVSVSLKFLHFDLLRSNPGREIVELYRDMDPSVLDDELESIRDPWAQRSGLEALCELGLTDRRLGLLRIHLKTVYCHPAALGYVQRALEKCWNAATLSMVVETVGGFDEWPEEWQQVFWDFINSVAARITSADRSVLEETIPVAKTPFARRVLRIWRQKTLDSRVGLSRIEPGDSVS
jgi:hypothetical protein